jgi:hypothetical protein
MNAVKTKKHIFPIEWIEDNERLIAAAPKLLEEHKTDLPILEDLLSNPFLSTLQKIALEGMINDKKAIIKKATAHRR